MFLVFYFFFVLMFGIDHTRRHNEHMEYIYTYIVRYDRVCVCVEGNKEGMTPTKRFFFFPCLSRTGMDG